MRGGAALTGLALFAWSSKLHHVFGGGPRGATVHGGSRLLRHTEPHGKRSWLWDSSVCFMGKLAWLIWACLVACSLCARIRVPASIWSVCLLVTAVCTLALNMPLFLRSLPAYVVLAWALCSTPAVV